MRFNSATDFSHDDLVDLCKKTSFKSQMEANQCLLDLQDYLARLTDEITQVRDDKGAEKLKELYNALVLANNNVGSCLGNY